MTTLNVIQFYFIIIYYIGTKLEYHKMYMSGIKYGRYYNKTSYNNHHKSNRRLNVELLIRH